MINGINMKKTLIYTSIYNNLFGTEFGGRPSKEWCYKYGLLCILNLNPEKTICFIDRSELLDLENFFYGEHKVSRDKLELIVFDLHDSKHKDKYDKLKDLDYMKTSDRCYEIQYNKFFWLEKIENLDSYEKVYWFDAGLSKGDLFPEEYRSGEGIAFSYNCNLFQPSKLESLNKITDDKFFLCGKSNYDVYYWERTLPERYYKEYCNKLHIIGGFFGGNLKNLLEFKDLFEQQLLQLIEDKELFYEEFIMSCLYYNNKEKFNLLSFDMWNDHIHKYDGAKYFYQMFTEDL